jgi:hypothetical protein
MRRNTQRGEPVPDAPRNRGIYVIQNKATGKQLGLPNSSIVGVFKEQHIVPRDRGAVWELEFVTVADSLHCYRFRTAGPFPWSDLEDPDSDFGRLDSDPERQVYAHRPNDTESQIWQPEPLADGSFLLFNRATRLALDGTNGDIYTNSPNFNDSQHWGFFTAPPDVF